jgi:hypothetical protein
MHSAGVSWLVVCAKRQHNHKQRRPVLHARLRRLLLVNVWRWLLSVHQLVQADEMNHHLSSVLPSLLMLGSLIGDMTCPPVLSDVGSSTTAAVVKELCN